MAEIISQSILDIIRSDHSRVMASLDELAARTPAVDVSNRFATVEKDLIGHMHAEEKIFYPRLERELRNSIETARSEHDQVRQMLRELKSMQMDDRWVARLESMRLAIKEHVVKEEGPLFDAAARMFSTAELFDLGRRFEEAKPKGLLGDIGTKIAEVLG
jgi:iron-sulfur cluster repair protein YtfE (RIC family)